MTTTTKTSVPMVRKDDFSKRTWEILIIHKIPLHYYSRYKNIQSFDKHEKENPNRLIQRPGKMITKEPKIN